MGKPEMANARHANTEAMEVGGSVAGAGCDGIEWMRPNQPCAGERLLAFGNLKKILRVEGSQHKLRCALTLATVTLVSWL